MDEVINTRFTLGSVAAAESMLSVPFSAGSYNSFFQSLCVVTSVWAASKKVVTVKDVRYLGRNHYRLARRHVRLNRRP